MGQYYIIANIDKREFIDPSDFGDGSKLLDFTSAGQGVMQALAILTSQGNGDGNGDICRIAYESQKTEFEPQDFETVHHEWEVDYDHNHKQLPEGQKHRARIMVPRLAGHWQGDRIVTAGDYGAAGDFLSLAEQLKAGAIKLRRQFEYERDQYETKYPRKFDFNRWLESEPDAEVNLYEAAQYLYKDLGPAIKSQIAAYDEGRTASFNMDSYAQEALCRRLLAEYDYKLLTGKGRNRRSKWRLHWLDPEGLDSFLRRWSDPEDLKRVKAWLRKQHLEPWHREALKCYKGWRDGRESIDTKKLEEIYYQAGFRKDPEYRNRWLPPKLLPTNEILEAALAVEAVVNETPYQPLTVDEVDQGHMERVADNAGIPLRHRVIDLDGSGVGS